MVAPITIKGAIVGMRATSNGLYCFDSLAIAGAPGAYCVSFNIVSSPTPFGGCEGPESPKLMGVLSRENHPAAFNVRISGPFSKRLTHNLGGGLNLPGATSRSVFFDSNVTVPLDKFGIANLSRKAGCAFDFCNRVGSHKARARFRMVKGGSNITCLIGSSGFSEAMRVGNVRPGSRNIICVRVGPNPGGMR